MAKSDTVLARIKALDEERARLLDDAKAQALASAQSAIDELNSLGFNYRLIEAKAGAIINTAPSGTRRSGIRDDVYNAVKNAGEEGTSPSAIREALGITDKSGSQSVANALSALKKANKIGEKNGNYVVA